MSADPIIHGIVLAAGASSRLGSPKQLLRANNETLLGKVTQILHSVCQTPPLVVLGAHWREITDSLGNALPFVCVNDNWQSGMGSGLTQALNALPNHTDGALIAVCDQPAIPKSHYERLHAEFCQAPTRGVATIAANTRMVPAVLPRAAFAEVANNSQTGARRWLRESADITEIDCAAAGRDIDTIKDWQEWLKTTKPS